MAADSWAQRLSKLPPGIGVYSTLKDNVTHEIEIIQGKSDIEIDDSKLEGIKKQLNELLDMLSDDYNTKRSPTMLGKSVEAFNIECRDVEEILSRTDPKLCADFKNSLSNLRNLTEEMGVTGTYRGFR